MENKKIRKGLYDKINDSKLAVAEFGNLINKITNKSEKNKGELYIAENNLQNIDLFKTNADMLNKTLATNKCPNEIILLNELYLIKLGSIGTGTLEQISSSLLGKYDPSKPNKKTSYKEIEDTIKKYSGKELSKSFLEDFNGIFNEFKNLRNESAHSNLAKKILVKEDSNYRKNDSKNLFYINKKQPKESFDKKDLVLKLDGTESGLTDKLNEYGVKYLKMVEDLYKGLSDYSKKFIIENEISSSDKVSKPHYIDIRPKNLNNLPFEFKLKDNY